MKRQQKPAFFVDKRRAVAGENHEENIDKRFKAQRWQWDFGIFSQSFEKISLHLKEHIHVAGIRRSRGGVGSTFPETIIDPSIFGTWGS